ncbi:MAG: methyltransferase domain-containing protein [Solirubrobacteraceae bacterium]
MFEDSLQERAERLAQTRFLGGPTYDFERMGRAGLEVLLREGLTPSSRVLDVGCGALRLGYWLMRFLDPGCYFGIEPNQDMLNVGLQELIEPEVVERAEAHFDFNDDFDFSVFGESFDFVVARSIWTHASKAQIGAMLASFAAASAPGGVFMASYYPAGAWFKVGHRWPRLESLVTSLPLAGVSPILASLPSVGRSNEYDDDTWIGRSHESADPGVIKHSLRWVAGEASRHGLTVQLMPYRVLHHQYWLRIARM